MRASIEKWLVSEWYGARVPRWYLRMLVPLYRGAFLRHSEKTGQGVQAMYQACLPVIIVGNITVGGSGKTPLVIHLCQLASQLNLRPGIASTGYGRHGHETCLVQASSDARLCGDEPVMLATRTGAPVVVAKNRLDAVKTLENMDLDLIISDDGLQQIDLYRDAELCVIDGERGLGNTQLLPAGPLRETPDRLTSVDFVVSKGPWSKRPDNLVTNVMHLDATVIRSLNDDSEYPADQFAHSNTGKLYHAFAGIGHPEQFFMLLENLNIRICRHAMPDHHRYTIKDFRPLTDQSLIIMTEKDAVKCRSLGLKNAWYVPVASRVEGEFDDQVKTLMAKLMKVDE